MRSRTKTSPIPAFTMASLGCVAITVIGISSAALAAPINMSPVGLAEPVTTITFDEVGLADDTRISAEFADLGVTFLPELYYRTGDNPDWDNIIGPNLRSGNLAGDILHRTFSLSFFPPRSSAAFVAIAQPPTPTTFTAKLNGVELESFEADVVIGDPANFFGFMDIVFDEIEVSYTAETRMRIDSLQLGEQVGGAPFQITNVDLNPANNEVTVTWPSRVGEIFSIEWSDDLIIFTELDDGIEGLDGTTSYTDTVPAESKMRYYRVKRL